MVRSLTSHYPAVQVTAELQLVIFILKKCQEQGRVERFLGFTRYSINGEKTFLKKLTTGQISTLAVQFSCSRQGYYYYMGTYQRRFW